jgi:cell division septation protein DedD
MEVGYMKVICPKCQFENQADSSRVVCARCATIVEVKLDQGTGFDSNGKRQTARLPFASNSPSSGSQQLGGQPFSQGNDIYATRIGDDFNDVLDVPDAPMNYSTTVEPAPMFEDVFTAPSQDQTAVYDFASYEKTTPIGGFATSATRQRETQDYMEPSEQEFVSWPVLPENTADEEEVAGSNRGGLFIRVGLIVGVFGVLCFLAYYFLGDFIAKRRSQETNIVAANAQNGNPQAPPSQSSSPIAAPNLASNTDTNQIPVVTPKPPDSIAQQNPKANNESKPVNIPPITNPDALAGRIGRADPPKPAPQIPSAPNKGNLTVQVGSFRDQAEANERAARLKSAGAADARVVKVEIPGKGVWYRVQVGGFSSREEAMSYGGQLRSKGVASDFIVTTIGK